MNKASELRSALYGTAWALQPEYIHTMLARLQMLSSSGGYSADGVKEATKAAHGIEAARRQQISASTGGSVVVLPLYGLITQRSNWMSYFFGGTSVDGFTLQFRQALADPNITAIVIDVDSPGGSVAGVDELWSEIYAARGKKKIVAISNTLNASAAYYISSAASEVVVMPSSLTGSIGVYQTHEDDSQYLENVGVKITLISAGKYKTEGNSYEPLGDVAQQAAKKIVAGYYAMFTKAVAKGRGRKVSDVTNGFGEGRVLMAADAVAEGLADRIATLDEVLAKFGVMRPIDGTGYATADAEVPHASTETSLPDAKGKGGKQDDAGDGADPDDTEDQDAPGDEDGDTDDQEDPGEGDVDDPGDEDSDQDDDKKGNAGKGKKSKSKATAEADAVALEKEAIAIRLKL
jgi:signal peptide peptidase SppA